MKPKTLLLLLLLNLSSNVFGQQVFFKHYTGKVYTTAQRDSIALAGNIISYQDTTKIADSTIYAFYFYDQKLTYSAFQKKYYKKPLPTIKLPDLQGNIVDTDELKGKVILINFWSTTCGPCIAEMPQMNELMRDYSDNVVFIGIALENEKKVRSLLKKFRFDFTILANGKKLFEELGIDSYPVNFFVDETGIIQRVEKGTPVETGPDGKIAKVDGQWKTLVYKNYSKILDELLAKR